MEATGFHYLLSVHQPAELFGPLDLEAFQKGTYHIRTSGMLPGGSNRFPRRGLPGQQPDPEFLLTIVNGRVFHSSNVRQSVPLACLVGASTYCPKTRG
jgi:MoxR-like ATPase